MARVCDNSVFQPRGGSADSEYRTIVLEEPLSI